MARVLIVQPWIPQYRVAFFDGLKSSLESEDVHLSLIHGAPPSGMGARGDARALDWAVPTPTRSFGGNRGLEWHRMRGHVRGQDLIIVEQALHSLETFPLLLRSKVGGPRVAMWGHGTTYTKAQSGWELRAKMALTQQASWFFAYTQGGAGRVIASGFPSDRVTVVQNSTDTAATARWAADATSEDFASLRRRMSLPSGRFALFLGALDTSKRLDLLLEAGHSLAARDATFHLVVAGGGPSSQQDAMADSAARYEWLSYVGPVFDEDKALLLASAEVLLMPGRVGLAVTDAFAAGLPLVTTQWPFHAPEFEYVQHGQNGWITEDSVPAYVTGVERVWSDDALRQLLAQGSARSAQISSLQAMVDNFAGGVLSALASSRSR